MHKLQLLSNNTKVEEVEWCLCNGVSQVLIERKIFGFYRWPGNRTWNLDSEDTNNIECIGSPGTLGQPH